MNAARCEEQLEELRRRIRELEFLAAKNPAKFCVPPSGAEYLEIRGMRYALSLFDGLGSFLPLGACFELLGREGVITLHAIETELEARRMLRTVIARQLQRDAVAKIIDFGE